MKKISLHVLCVLLGLVGTGNLMAQESETASGKNLVKFNALTLLGGKFSFEYERLLNDRISVGTAVSFRPQAGLPFKSSVKTNVDSESVNDLLDGFESGNFSITPEVRFYLSSRGTFRGFYIAPFVKYAKFDATVPYEFEIEEDYQGQTVYSRQETIPLSGDITSVTAGLSFGFNFKLTKSLHLDWRIIGPGYGTAKGQIEGAMNMDANEQAALREAFRELQDNLENELPLSIKTDYEVNTSGAKLKVLNSPWASIRSGLSISYRF